MRILITGGAGCLGSNLIEHWLPAGHEIAVIDNFATGKREVVPPVPGLVVVEASIVDAGIVDGLVNDFAPDVIVHSAAAYKDPADWRTDADTNVIGSINVARAAERAGVRQVVNFQTALSYGRPLSLPIPVDHPAAPFTSYGISKTAGEAYMLMSPVPTVSLRLANVTGPRLAIGPIPSFYKRLKAGQSCFCSDTARDFLDVSDFLSLMDKVVAKPEVTGVFNVSSGEAHSIKEIFDLVAAYLGLGKIDVPIVPAAADDVPVVSLDPARTVSQYGWTALVSFKDTIEKQLAWYDRYGITDVYSHLKAPGAVS